MTGPLDRVDRQRRRLDRLILVWPFWAMLVTGLGFWFDRRDGRPFDWSGLVPGAAILLLGGLVYLGCRLNLRHIRRLLERAGAR